MNDETAPDLVIRCREEDIIGQPVLVACPRCGMPQPSLEGTSHLCCWRCGFCEYGEEDGCPGCVARAECNDREKGGG